MKLGIDYGTTMSESATVIEETPKHLMAPGQGPIPSLVHYWEQRDPQYHVGYDVTDAERSGKDLGLIRDIKMYLGQDIPVNGRRIPAHQLAALIIKQVIDVAKRQAGRKGLDESIETLVISVPARFNAAQLQLLRNTVAKVSGIDVADIRLIKEPVAAAYYMYEQDIVKRNSKTIFVFDMGGGTLDCSIVRKTNNGGVPYVEEKSDTIMCAGRNFDDVAADLIIDNAREQENIDLDRHGSPELMRWGEQLKILLTNSEKVPVSVQHEGFQYNIVVTREEFEERARPLLNRALDFMDSMLAECGRVDEIICVGGSSSMPMIMKGICARHPDISVEVKNPQLAIAYGAAIYAQDDEKGNTSIMLKAPFTYAHRAFGNGENVEYLCGHVMRGAELPITSKEPYITRDDGDRVSIRIYAIDEYSEHVQFDPDKHGDPILDVDLKFHAKYPKGTPFDLTLTLDRNGILHAEAQTKMGDSVTAQVNVLDSSSH
ncbi:DnaK family protein [Bifidobacterium italicum]|uniref:DnaK family protein n=1 Tax=Bifidobacterium italicum TaxID=1960968 RepID=A0A2A2EG11_9BIFI|nr:Hsp70 family protein [Bifidobacterium italicum]PAU67838.1 DnaK family protein [Bifidobacterium italicum]